MESMKKMGETLARLRNWTSNAIRQQATLDAPMGKSSHSVWPKLLLMSACLTPIITMAYGQSLNASQSGAINDAIRKCWINQNKGKTLDGHIMGDIMSVQLVMHLDERGAANRVEIGDNDRGRLADPPFRAFATSVLSAVLDPDCTIPVPRDLMGTKSTLTLRFKP